jgi:hypothetical protein
MVVVGLAIVFGMSAAITDIDSENSLKPMMFRA